jgi:hypothetical protein
VQGLGKPRKSLDELIFAYYNAMMSLLKKWSSREGE